MIGILYFSSTGNSLYIAQKVQKRIGGQIKYIPNYKGTGNEFEKIILVTPIYSYGMPTFVYDIIPRLSKTPELIVIQNYGGMTGGADYFMYQYAVEQGLNIKSVYVLKMPENFTTTFSVPKLYVRHTLKSADRRIDNVIDNICVGNDRLPQKRRTRVDTYLKNKSNWHLIGEAFSATDACVKCKKCISICPANNICFSNGKIVFSNQCVACLGCYHRCPQKAIVYKGKNKKDRYINPNICEGHIGKDM